MPAVVARGGSRRRTISEINMVPFIDVMLVLLIIFMVTAPLIAPSLIDLPSAGKAARAPDKVLQVSIAKDESLLFKADGEQRPVTLASLPASVRQAQRGDASLPVVIAADKSVRYETVVNVMSTLQKSGIARVGLSVQLAP